MRISDTDLLLDHQMISVFKVIAGERAGEVFEIQNVEEQEIGLGRIQDNEFVIDDPLVARRHAQIILRGKHLFVVDLGTHNGTFLNSSRIVEHSSQLVKSGDQIKIGSTVLEII